MDAINGNVDLTFNHTYHGERKEPRHVWSVVGDRGGVHIWAVE